MNCLFVLLNCLFIFRNQIIKYLLKYMICPYVCDEECIETLLFDGFWISVGCVILSLIISLYLIFRHLMNFNMPYF